MLRPMKNNIGSLLTKRAEISPTVEAFVEVERKRRFTFSQLNQRANRIANALKDQGVQPGDRVILLVMNGIEFIETYFGGAKIGAVLVPVNWRLAPAEIAYILQDSGATSIVYDSEFDEAINAIQAGEHGDTDISNWIRKDNTEGGDNPDFGLDYETLTEAAPSTEPALGAFDDDLLFIMYTSGTTGRPKGAMQTHDTMLWSHLTCLTTSDMRGDDNFLLSLPMFHVGCMLPASQMVHRGSKGIIMRNIDFAVMFQAIQDEKVSIFMSVPALLQFMLLFPDRDKYDISSVRWIATGAAPVPLSLLRDYKELGIVIYQAYGLTEACGPGTVLSPEDAETKEGSAGRPQMHTAMRVVDEDGKDVVPGSGQVGELLLSGLHIMKGYWNKPEATAEALRDGWLYTDDLCTIDEDGCITICDRKKDMIISGGENIYPAELEKILSDCPEVKEVAVIGMPSKKWGETPAAIVVPADGATPTAESLTEYCKKHLASFKTPKVFEFTDTLPRNPSGKLLKHEIRKSFPGPAPE